jgi:hypothetical protein
MNLYYYVVALTIRITIQADTARTTGKGLTSSEPPISLFLKAKRLSGVSSDFADAIPA